MGMVPALVNWIYVVGMAFTAHYGLRTLPTLCPALLRTALPALSAAAGAAGAAARAAAVSASPTVVWVLDAAVAQLRALEGRRRPTVAETRSAVSTVDERAV